MPRVNREWGRENKQVHVVREGVSEGGSEQGERE